MVYRGEDEITSVDNKIDQVWKDVFLFLVTFQDKFYSQNIEQNPSINISEIKITTTDRKRFIENISTDENFSDFEEFAKLINSTKFYKILFNIAKDNQVISKINDFLNIVDLSEFYYGKISSLTDYNQIIDYLESDSSALNELGKYFYENGGILSKVGVKRKYLDDEEFLSKYRQSMVGKPCPYCGERITVVEIDHFLPKSKYPLLSIYSSNLVPSCVECNKEKKEKLQLPISHPLKFNHLKHIKFSFNDYTAIAVPNLDDEGESLLVKNMIEITNFNRLFRESIIAPDLRKLDLIISENPDDIEKLIDSVGFEFISDIKKKLYKDYVDKCLEQSMLQDYSCFYSISREI